MYESVTAEELLGNMLEPLKGSGDKGEYAALWKVFCQSISVTERENLRVQRQNLPYKYRRYMPEFW